MYHSAHEAECEDKCNGKEACEEFAEPALESSLNIVYRAAGNAAVGVYDTGLLCQNSLGIDGSHSEEGDYPHPKDCAGSAYENCAAGTDNVTGTDLRRDCSGQCLERAHAALVLIALEADVSEHLAPRFAEAADLNKSGLYREPESAAHKQEYKHVV